MKTMIVVFVLFLSQLSSAGGSSCISDGTCAVTASDFQMRVTPGTVCRGPGFAVQINDLVKANNGNKPNEVYFHSQLLDAAILKSQFNFDAESLYQCKGCEVRFKEFDQSIALYNHKYVELQEDNWIGWEIVTLNIKVQDQNARTLNVSLISADRGQTFSLSDFYDRPFTKNEYFCEGLVFQPIKSQ